MAGIALELDRQGLFLRLGRVEVYARKDRERAWFFDRSTDATEASAGHFRVTFSRAPEPRTDPTTL